MCSEVLNPNTHLRETAKVAVPASPWAKGLTEVGQEGCTPNREEASTRRCFRIKLTRNKGSRG